MPATEATPTILVVEDNRDVLAVIAHTLTAHGYAVTRAYGAGPTIDIALFGKGRVRTYSAYSPGEVCSYVSGKIDMKRGRLGERLRSMKLHAM